MTCDECGRTGIDPLYRLCGRCAEGDAKTWEIEDNESNEPTLTRDQRSEGEP